MINLDKENVQAAHIKPDRYGMAAISYIYKAFGDNIRSKEYWPWSERVGNDWVWTKSKGTDSDLCQAIYFILAALYKLEADEEENINTLSADGDIKKLRKRLNKINTSIDIANEITKAINQTTEETQTDKFNIDSQFGNN